MIEQKATSTNLDSLIQFQKKDISLEPFFEQSPDVLCIAGFDGYFKKVNPAFQQLLGYPLEEIYSKPINDFILDEDKAVTDKRREQLKHDKPLLNFENRYVKRSGEVVWLSWTSIPLKSERLVYAIAKEITHVKKLEEERNILLAKLSNVNKNLKLLTYSTSHDLRSPVANLQMVFDLLDMSKIKDEETIEILESMNMATQNLKNTLNEYLDVLEREEKETEAEIEEVDLRAIFDQVCKSIDSLIKGSQATFKLDLKAFSIVHFSRIYAESIFLNLITNSIKYSKADEFPVISIRAKLNNGIKQLSFSDNGKGFDAIMLKDRMFGLRQKFTDHKDSKGIGLYLIHNNIQSMGGKIDVESEVGRGATFTITFK
ncbi:sensor histidine kinase [Owenweeksia hongkongensis]|uniref:sensor histidine kinase n=1 Tax=Owenweeksia hongkongensis TaxID=253245 RepID=UPI003A8D54B5